MEKIFLASNSPRRKEILKAGNICFTVVKSGYQEVSPKFYDENIIKENSLNKALDAAKSITENGIVIGADTMVILEDEGNSVCLLKPQSYNEAFLMLKKLSGKVHRVITSVSMVKIPKGQSFTEILETKVKFRKISDDEISKYIEDFKPLDKAGSYGIQDFISPDEAKNPPRSSFIEEIDGDYYNVMGISLKKVNEMLQKLC